MACLSYIKTWQQSREQYSEKKSMKKVNGNKEII